MNFGLSDGYRLLKLLDGRNERPVLDQNSVAEEIAEADEDLAKSLASFQRFISEALICLEEGADSDALLEKLMYMRMHAMRVGGYFERFVDDFDKAFKE